MFDLLAGVESLRYPAAGQRKRIDAAKQLIVKLRMTRFDRVVNHLLADRTQCIQIRFRSQQTIIISISTKRQVDKTLLALFVLLVRQFNWKTNIVSYGLYLVLMFRIG